MKRTVRKIGNARGVLIPASFLAACKIESEIDLRLEGNRIIIEPPRAPRAGWFDGYQPDLDEDAWADLVETADEDRDRDWQW